MHITPLVLLYRSSLVFDNSADLLPLVQQKTAQDLDSLWFHSASAQVIHNRYFSEVHPNKSNWTKTIYADGIDVIIAGNCNAAQNIISKRSLNI